MPTSTTFLFPLDRPGELLTCDTEGKAFPNGHSQRGMRHTARVPVARVLERGLEQEEGGEGVGAVHVVAVAGEHDILQHLGYAAPTWAQRLFKPLHVHVQWVVAGRLAQHLLLPTHGQRQL